MLNDGIPIIYQGQEQHLNGGASPACREAVWLTGYDTTFWGYEFVTRVNKIRRQAINTDSEYVTTHAYAIYSDSSAIAMRKGNENRQVVAVFQNNGADSADYSIDLYTAYESGVDVTEILTCTNQTVDDEGKLTVELKAGLPAIFFPSNRMNGSQICGFSNKSTLTTGSTSDAVRGFGPSRLDLGSILLAGVAVLAGSWLL